ncbi:MAG: methyltransferase domain-containing protein [Candidatus Manganitrophus sp. SB1]|nr:methyltransferase domain-containing protein [Candidatus Manganitrophus morganii]
MVTEPNYSAEYDNYWTRRDRIGESSGNLELTADQIVMICGFGSILDIGSGEGALVAALLRRGLDAYGLDVSRVVVSRCQKRMPGRFSLGSVLYIPFRDSSFHTVVTTDCMEHLTPEDVPKALQEIRRVAGRYVFLKLATIRDRDDHWHLTVEKRAWWEARCFEAGFRKHPGYYRINDYESLNQDGWQIVIPLEKTPEKVLISYPLASLNEERGLHMDMLRDSGERSDAHVIRYQWACDYIKPGDRVLDAACGLGYGSHVIQYMTQAEKIVGFDGSEYAVNYATQSFAYENGQVEYLWGILPDALSSYKDGSFDVIVSFETLEHVADPPALLKEFHRLLSPGGRIIVSVPNNWSDETGRDPNPYHLHVYDWTRLQGELASHFVLEEAFAQTASRCKNSHNGNQWETRPRSFRKVAITEQVPADCEWWLMVAMKSPLGTTQDYQERMFHNIAHAGHASIRYAESYQNPWLMHAMVNVGYRLKRVDALEKLASEVMSVSPKNSSDYAAALSVKAYRVLERCFAEALAVREIIGCIDVVVADPPEGPMGLRWQVSLLFVKAKLLQRGGHLERAKATFVKCAGLDVRGFGIHLATKTTEAWFNAGKIAYSLSDKEEARSYWERGVDCGNILLSASLDDILINRSFPNRFNHGDGVREYTVAWDNIARCANGLHLLRRGGELDPAALENCFQTEYSVVTQDLIECRRQLVERTRELVETREILLERTALLEQSSKGVSDLTRELVETRQTLVDRSKMLEEIRNSFRYRIKNKLKIFFNKL